jgi:hypothetical protein
LREAEEMKEAINESAINDVFKFINDVLSGNFELVYKLVASDSSSPLLKSIS